MSDTFASTLDDTIVMEMQDELTSEERAYWEASIERDILNPNRGKVHRPIEELWKKLEDSVKKHYAGVSC
ncbi:MAG: hypothetical protein IJU19_02565 [Bacteroidales bacterium]|nr:hypothetical protein [Bacteroidales bacterium]